MRRALWIAGLALLLAAPALAQEAPPQPHPLPSFHAPLADGAAEPAAAPSGASAAPLAGNPAADAIATAVATPQPVRLQALVTDGGQPINEGVVWRVYNTRTDSTGRLQLAARSDTAIANVELPPGTYVVHVAYGRAQATDTLTVQEGSNSKSLALEAGGLRLNAAITGDVPIPINLLRFDVFLPGNNDADRIVVAENVGANDILTVNAGTYHVVSHFGRVNADVRADLRVEPGELTDVVLYHHAAQVSFRLASEAGGEAIADVDWQVTTAGSSASVFSDTGAFPSTVLQEGNYTVTARQGNTSYSRTFELRAGPAVEIEVLTTRG